MPAPELLAQLCELGLTKNEALAYLTLVEEAPAEGLTGYEVAARSGIPRSAVYAVMRKLEGSGAAFATGDSPARYAPTDPTRLVERMRDDARVRLDRLQEALARLPRVSRPEPIWILHAYEDVLERIDGLLRSATRSVYLSLWSRELDRLAPALASLPAEVHKVLYSPDAVPQPPPGFSCWIDSVAGDPPKAAWSHRGLVVVDRRQALIGGTEPDADNQTVLTTNPSLVNVATDHIILDITRLAHQTGRDCSGVVGEMMRPHLS